MSTENRVVYFVKRPVGMVKADAFEIRREPIPQISGDGSLLVKSAYASVDPYMRGRMSERKSYTAPFDLPSPMQGAMVGQVVDPGSTGFKAGSWVFGAWPWADYAVVATHSLRELEPDVSPTAALHVLGMTGLTAYIGLTQFGRPQPSEHLVVSAAAGAVGSLVGQIGRLLGLSVVGIAGGPEKCQWLVSDLGFDAAVNYQATDFAHQLREALSVGVDVYFDNVGGLVTDQVMAHLNPHARIVVCGQIALYNLDKPVVERPRFSDLLTNRATATGFIVGEHQALYPQALKQLATWYQSGELKAEETIVQGFDQLIGAFLGLFFGANRGKTIVKLV